MKQTFRGSVALHPDNLEHRVNPACLRSGALKLQMRDNREHRVNPAPIDRMKQTFRGSVSLFILTILEILEILLGFKGIWDSYAEECALCRQKRMA